MQHAHPHLLRAAGAACAHFTRLTHLVLHCAALHCTTLGLAAGLMEEVQRQMECHHGGEAVSLHVRCSNDAALRLYGPNGLGYRIEKTIDVS